MAHLDSPFVVSDWRAGFVHEIDSLSFCCLSTHINARGSSNIKRCFYAYKG